MGAMIPKPRLLNALNWHRALGELVLIVLGILIALAISDWNDRRIQRIQEKALLAEIRTTLLSDLDEFERRQAMLQETVPRIEELSRVLNTGMDYEPAFDQLFGAAYGVHSINLNTTAFETLKSAGLQSISNTGLRFRIVRIFDHHYERVQTEREIDIGTTLDVMRPYYLQHFRDLRFHQSATPIDYELVANDTYFHNLVDYRLAVLNSNQLASYPVVMAEIREVLNILEDELSRAGAIE